MTDDVGLTCGRVLEDKVDMKVEKDISQIIS